MDQSLSKYAGVLLEKKLPDRLYRNNECYGESKFNIVDVMVYEITELGNIDILEYCSTHYDFVESLNQKIQTLINNISNNKFEGTDHEITEVENVCIEIINGIFDLTGVYVQFGLWLCSKEAAYELYDGTAENIKAYPTSDIVLADLGYDGKLFGYTEIPKEIDED